LLGEVDFVLQLDCFVWVGLEEKESEQEERKREKKEGKKDGEGRRQRVEGASQVKTGWMDVIV
jgi:hypothetical protein